MAKGILSLIKADVSAIQFEDTLKEQGIATTTDNTSSKFVYLQQNLTFYKPIKLKAVRWYIRQSGTYKLEVIRRIDNTIIATIPEFIRTVAWSDLDFGEEPVLLLGGRYIFRLTRLTGSTTWTDARDLGTVHYDDFTIEGGYYNGNSTRYTAPTVFIYHNSIINI